MYHKMSDNQKDQLSRWMPTLVAILAIVGQVFYFGQRLGANEQRLESVHGIAVNSVSRSEYISDKTSAAVQVADVKTALRDLNQKMDRLIERTQRYAPLTDKPQ